MLARFADAALTRSEMKNVKGGSIMCRQTIFYSNKVNGKESTTFISQKGYCSGSTLEQCKSYASNWCQEQMMTLWNQPGGYYMNGGQHCFAGLLNLFIVDFSLL